MANAEMKIDINVTKSFYYYLILNLPKKIVKKFSKLICFLLQNKTILTVSVNGKNKTEYNFRQLLIHFNQA